MVAVGNHVPQPSINRNARITYQLHFDHSQLFISKLKCIAGYRSIVLGALFFQSTHSLVISSAFRSLLPPIVAENRTQKFKRWPDTNTRITHEIKRDVFAFVKKKC